MAPTQSTRPPKSRNADRASVWLGLCTLLAALPGLAQTVSLASAQPTAFAALSPSNIAPASPAPATSPAASQPLPAAAADHEALFAQARQWVMAKEQLPADQVQFAALDSRVRIAPCRESLQFDYPFSSSRETLRVRCAAPTAWQLFLRLNNPPAALSRPASNPNVPVRASAAVTMQPPMKTVVVPKRLLQRGTEIDASMLEEVQKPALGLDPLAIGSLKDVARAEAVRDLPAGTVLRSYDIKRSLMVRKGQSAMLTVGQNGSFQITVRVEAQQDGHLGEQIRLKNPESGRLISGVVTGPNALKGL